VRLRCGKSLVSTLLSQPQMANYELRSLEVTGRSDLAVYHITIVPQNKQEFFGLDSLPAPASPSLAGFMTTEDREHATDRETRKLLHYLNLALDPKVGQEAAVDNFAAKLLEKLGYDDGDRIIFTRHWLSAE